jgi:transketolase
MADVIRVLAMDAVEQAKSGHPGMPMGMADVATVLWSRFLKFDPTRPDWPDRDRFVLSAGHGSMLLYALLHLTGYPGWSLEELKRFRQLGSRTAGHPEYGHGPGIETTTGPLGQGLANAVGMALAERLLNARFGDDLVDHRTYVIAGDGCLMEGVSHEAISLAGHLQLGKLVVLWDDNAVSIDGSTSLATSDDQLARFDAAGWSVAAVDGHDPEAVAVALARAQTSERPSLIGCRTTIAFGAPTKAGTAAAHGAPLGAGEIAAARARLGWTEPPFVVPADVAQWWRALGARGAAARAAWQKRLESAPAESRRRFERGLAGELHEGAAAALAAVRGKFLAEAPKTATRQASGMVLDALAAACPELIGGSADLTGSNNTKAKGQKVVRSGDFSGSYLHYGVREHGMAAAMNGLAVHGGLVPYGGTFLVFSDYCRPALRLSALMGLRVIYVMTHDSIGLGEDGPTHQPIEHLASLRAIPPQGVPSSRCGGDGGMLGTGARVPAHALGAGADAAGGAGAAARSRGGQPLRARRLCAGRGRRRAAPEPHRHRIGGRGRDVGTRAAPGPRHRRGGGIDAVLGAFRRRAVCLSRERARRCAAHRRRGGVALRLGTLCRRRRNGHRHDRLRCLGAGGGSLSPFRHHRRARRRGGAADSIASRSNTRR